MFRKKLNDIFSSRVFYIVFSLLVSVALWMFVELNENVVHTRTVEGIEIVYRNEEMLRDRGLLITSRSPQTMTLTFEGPRSIMMQLTNQSVKVEVDLANVTSTANTALTYDIIYPAGIDHNLFSARRDVARVALTFDRMAERPIMVYVNYRGGTASDDLIAEPPEFDPQTIMVYGPEDAVSQIFRAYVPIMRENLSSTITEDWEFEFVDENFERIDDSLLELVSTDQELIRVTIPVKQMREVPLTVELMYGAGSSAQNTNVTIDPPVITISGEPEAVRAFNSIVLGTIDMTRFGRSNNTEAFSIIVPNHLTNQSGETEARVLVDVLGIDIDFYSTSNFHLINTPSGYRVDFISTSLDVRVRGRREDLDRVSHENIRVVADLRDMSPGSQSVPATVHVDGFDPGVVGAVGDYRITVRIVSDTS